MRESRPLKCRTRVADLKFLGENEKDNNKIDNIVQFISYIVTHLNVLFMNN